MDETRLKEITSLLLTNTSGDYIRTSKTVLQQFYKQLCFSHPYMHFFDSVLDEKNGINKEFGKKKIFEKNQLQLMLLLL